MLTCASENETASFEVQSRPFSGLYAGLLGLMGVLGLSLNAVVLVGVCGNARLGTASICQPQRARVARLFLVQHTKTGEKYQNGHKIYQMAIKYTKLQKN
jgi:hypothetical protein